jgi:hypothetical protein
MAGIIIDSRRECTRQSVVTDREDSQNLPRRELPSHNVAMSTVHKPPPQPPAHDEGALPAWAVHIASSITAVSEEAMAATEARCTRVSRMSLPSGSTLLRGTDLCVIALPEDAREEHVSAAIRELGDALSRGVAVTAIAFPPVLGTAPPDYVNYLADLGIAIVRDPGRTSLMAATAYARRVLGLRSKALQHLGFRSRS